MGLFSFSKHKKRSIFHGAGYYTGSYLHSNSSRRYYNPRYAHTQPSLGQTILNAAGAALGGAVGAGVATNMAGKGGQIAATETQGTADDLGVYIPGRAASSAPASIACPRCATNVPAGAKFCLECGHELGGGFCSSCGAAFPSGAQFCGQCGAPR